MKTKGPPTPPRIVTGVMMAVQEKRPASDFVQASSSAAGVSPNVWRNAAERLRPAARCPTNRWSLAKTRGLAKLPASLERLAILKRYLYPARDASKCLPAFESLWCLPGRTDCRGLVN